jgi:hypothetical protein
VAASPGAPVEEGRQQRSGVRQKYLTAANATSHDLEHLDDSELE